MWVYGAGGASIEVCTGTFSLTQSEHRQTDSQTDRQSDRQTDGQTDGDGQRDRQTDRQTGAYSAVLPVGFPSPCPASETPSASAPPRLRDTYNGSR